MIKFPSVRSALHYTGAELIPSEHGYIIHSDGSDLVWPRLQVVAHGMLDGSDSNGLSVHLSFDIDMKMTYCSARSTYRSSCTAKTSTAFHVSNWTFAIREMSWKLRA